MILLSDKDTQYAKITYSFQTRKKPQRSGMHIKILLSLRTEQRGNLGSVWEFHMLRNTLIAAYFYKHKLKKLEILLQVATIFCYNLKRASLFLRFFVVVIEVYGIIVLSIIV